MPGAVRILLADGHAVVRLGLRALISHEPDLEVVGEAADGIGAVAQARALRPDMLILALQLPDMPGVQVIRALAETALDIRVLVLTMFADDEHVFPALQAGADGYLLKESGPSELLRGIRDVAAGKPALHPAIAARILKEVARTPPGSTSDALTRRDKDVLALVAQGLSNKAIARCLNLSERTVRSRVSTILAKLDLRSRTEAALYAVSTGLGRHDDRAM